MTQKKQKGHHRSRYQAKQQMLTTKREVITASFYNKFSGYKLLKVFSTREKTHNRDI